MDANSILNYIALTEDGTSLDCLNSKFKNLRSHVPVSRSIFVREGFEANLPAIASLELGSESLWWVLLMYNDIVDPLSDVPAGVTLRIPDLDSLMARLQSAPLQDPFQSYGFNSRYSVVSI